MDLFELGESFRRARLAAKHTQQRAAERSGMTRAQIRRFETGQLQELAAVELISLLEAVGLELHTRPIGPGPTLDDLLAELRTAAIPVRETRRRVRVPHSTNDDTTTDRSG
ncbi:helix-turn-helix transcriptional regulator [Burkholderia sp. THE68]|uniref:helix-turn-helix domain-containing protein n=1 Tax=Burkholderia sp. THE68 TaxID=758782 RepID=UPI0013899547|nr:helix-turn-helix transcriptional regulator [Burkholderia sp. THE68]